VFKRFDLSLSFHSFCSRIEFLNVDKFLRSMRSCVSGAFSIHVKFHSRVQILGVPCVETAVFAQDDINIVRHPASALQ